MKSQICVEILSNFNGWVCQMSNFRVVVVIVVVHASFGFLPGMIAHGHEDVKYAHYGLDFYPGNANHTVGSFAKILRDLEKLPFHSSRVFFDGCGTTPIYEAVLMGKEVCMSSLPEP